jgi:UDPglucose--hexose-1-phosphate uridylyltransferase
MRQKSVMGNIEFEKISSAFTILNPFNDFAPEEHRVEVRKDPLLGDTSIHNPYLKDKARAFFSENDAELIKKLVEESSKGCIFCSENVLHKTAQYPSDILSQGRIRTGEAVLFANLFSVGAYHPVIALGSKHFLKLSEFAPRLLAEGMKAAQEFLCSVYRTDASAIFTAVCANYLLPAGASLVHPHLQMLVTPLAYSYHARLLDACRLYHEKYGTSYFGDLVAEEKKIGARHIAEQDGWHWLAAFSPMGSNEITAIHDKEADFGALSNGDLQDLSHGISKVLLLYERLGHLSFNYALFSVRQGVRAEGFRCVFKIISRQNLYPNYRSDDYFLQKMLQTELIFNLPEELAEQLRKMF